MAELLAPGPRRSVRRKVKVIRFNAESGIDREAAAAAAVAATTPGGRDGATSPTARPASRASLSGVSLGLLPTPSPRSDVMATPTPIAAPTSPLSQGASPHAAPASPSAASIGDAPASPPAPRNRYERLVRRMDLVAMSGLDLDEQDTLTDIFLSSYKVIAVEAGGAVVRAMEGGATMYLVASGRVIVYSRNPDVNPTVFVGPGGCVEEAELFFQPPRERTVVADTGVELLCWYRSMFRDAMSRHPEIYEKLKAQMQVKIFKGIKTYITNEVEMFVPVLAEDPGRTERMLDEILEHLQMRMPRRGRILTPISGFYYILRGSVSINSISGEEVLGEGQHFGELSCLHDLPDTTVITALSAAQLLYIPRHAFASVIDKPAYASLYATLQLRAKQFYDKIVLFAMLWAVPFLRQLPQTEASSFIAQLIKHLEFRAIPDSTDIYDAFPDAKGALFVIKGLLREPRSAGREPSTVSQGGARAEFDATFNLYSLLYVTPRVPAATVGDTEFYVLHADDFQKALAASPYDSEVRRIARQDYHEQLLAQLLQRVRSFRDVPRAALLDLLEAMQVEEYRAGEVVFTPYTHEDKLLLLIRGQLDVESSGLLTHGVTSMVLTDGAHFNDLCLCNPTPQDAKVTAAADSYIMTLSRAQLERALAGHPPEVVAGILQKQKAAFNSEVLHGVMSDMPIFRGCSDTGMARLVDQLEMVAYEEQSFVVSQGTDCPLFILARGRLSLTKNGMECGHMTDGAHFAELNTCCPTPRINSVTVDTPCVVFYLHASALDALDEADRAAIEAQSKEEYKHRVLLDMLASSDIFSGTSDAFLQGLLGALVPEYRDIDEEFVQEGQAFSSIYFILRGKCIVWDEGRAIHNLNDGNSFGGVGLFHNVPRRTAVTATVDRTLAYVLTRSNYERIGRRHRRDHAKVQARAHDLFNNILSRMVRKVPMFAEVKPHIIKNVVHALKRESYEAGDRILSHGETLEKLYFAVRGSLMVTNDETNETTPIAEGGFWGDVVVLFDVPRHYTVDAVASEIEIMDTDGQSEPCDSPTMGSTTVVTSPMPTPAMQVTHLLPPATAASPLPESPSGRSRSLSVPSTSRSTARGSFLLAKEKPNDTRIYSLSRNDLMGIMQKYQVKGLWFSSPEGPELQKIRVTSRSQFESLVQEHFDAARFLTGVVQQKDPTFVKSVMGLMRKRIFRPGQVVVKHLAGGDEMFYIAQGEVEVLNHITHETQVLSDSRIFGEIALLFAVPRIYTVTAAKETQLYLIRRNDFEQQVMPKHETAVLQDLRLHNRLIVMIVKSIPVFATTASHPLHEQFCRDLVGHCFEQRAVEAGEKIVAFGDLPNALFVISRGKLEVTQLGPDGVPQTQILQDGGHVGAMTLLYDCPRTMSVTAVDNSVLHCCSRTAFENLIAENPTKFTPLRAQMESVGAGAVLDMFKSLLLSVDIFQERRGDPDFEECMSALAARMTMHNIGTRYDADMGEWVKETAIADGEAGEEMLIVVRGELGLYRKNKKIKSIRDGEWYHEDALFFHHPRVMRASAEVDTAYLRLTRADFEAVAPKYERIYNASRQGAWKVFKETTICPLLVEVPLFHACKNTPGVLDSIAEVLQKREVPTGTVLAEKEDITDHMIFVRRGCVNTLFYEASNKRITSRTRLSDYDFFGEAALLYNQQRNCTATTVQPTTLYILYRKDLHRILQAYPEVGVHINHLGETKYRQGVRLNLLSTVPVFSECDDQAFLSQVGFAMLHKSYEAGQYVYEPGESVNELHLVYEGELEYTHREEVRRIRAGGNIGVESLLLDTPRVASLKAIEPTTLFILQDSQFREVLHSNFPEKHAVLAAGMRKLMSAMLARSMWLNSPVFSRLAPGAACLHGLAERMVAVDIDAAEQLISRGQAKSLAYIISRGEGVVADDGCEQRVIRDSECHGELNLFEWRCPRTTEVTIADGSLVYALTKDAYLEVMAGYPEERGILDAAAREVFQSTVLLRIFQGVSLFCNCYDDIELMMALVKRLTQKVFIRNEPIVQENEGGNKMYIITRGLLLSSKDHKKTEITDSATFEDMALIYQTPRTVEYKALDETELFMLEKSDFAEVVAEFGPRARGVKEIARDRFHRYVLHDLIRSVPIFARCRSPEMIAQVAQVLVAQQYTKGSTIIKQGEGGNEMYFISRGKLSVLVGTMKVFELTDGNYFGEIALLYDTPRTASIVADMDSDLFMLPNTQFQKVIAEYPAEAAWIKEIAASRFRKHVLQDIVKKVPIFVDSAQNEEFLSTVVTNLHPRGYSPGEVIVTEGEGGDEMFFVSRGELDILVGGNVVHTLRDGDFFGEIAIVYDTPRTATIVARNKSQLFILTRGVLNDIMKVDHKLKDSIQDIAEQRFRKHVLDGFLRKVQLFANAGQGFIEDLTARLVIKNYRAGESVIREASGGNEMYFIARGLLDVEVGRISVAQLRDGDFFGEVALFYDTPRTASIVARQQSNLLLLHREDLFEVLAAYPTEAADIQSQALQRYQQFLLNYMLKKVPLFKNVTDEEFLVKLVSSLHSKMIDVEEYVVREGEGGDEMYFVSRGRLAIRTPSGQTIHTLRDGDFFGEISLIYNTPRTASIVATVQSQLFTLNRTDFMRVMSEYHRPAEEIRAIAKDRFQQLVLHDLVKNLPLLKRCSNNQSFILEIVKRLVPKGFESGQDIVSEGEGGAEMYFILRGHVHVCVAGNVVHRMKDGGYFGEVALIYNTPRTATIRTASPCLVLELKQRDFLKILLDYEDLVHDITSLARARLNDFVLQDLVKKVPIFSTHEGDDLQAFIKELVTCLEPRGYNKGEFVVTEGEGGEEMYFISQGKLKVDVGGTTVGQLKDGDFFGEIVLIYDTPRTANIIVENRAQLFVLQKSDFMSVMERYPRIAADIRIVAKQRFEQFVLSTLVSGVPFFKACQSPEFVDAIVACLYPRKVLKGTKLIREGTTGGDEMYFISRGELAVSVGGTKVKILKDGDLFGEIALLYDVPRTATIQAQTRANIYSLARDSFRKVLAEFPEEADRIQEIARGRFLQILKDVLCRNPMFRDRSDEFLDAIVTRLEPRNYPRGSTVVAEGEGGDQMFFVMRGELDIYVSQGRQKVAELRDFGYFGEVALVYDTPRTATIVSTSETSLVSLSRANLWAVVNKFPADSKPIMDIAEERLRSSILLDFVKRVPIFANIDLDDDIMKSLVLNLDPRGAEANEAVVQESEGGDEMFFVSQGHLEVQVRGKVVAEMTDGNFFGEIALIYDTPRTATIRAVVRTQLFVLKREDFNAVMEKFPKAFEGVKDVAKDRYREVVLEPFIKRIPIFRDSSEALIRDIVEVLQPRVVPVGDIVIQQGEIGDRMFFINQGRVEVIANGETVLEMTDGDFFGEIALVLNTPRTATVIVKSKTSMFELTSRDFENVRTQHVSESNAISTTANARFKKIAKITRLVAGTPRQDRALSGGNGMSRYPLPRRHPAPAPLHLQSSTLSKEGMPTVMLSTPQQLVNSQMSSFSGRPGRLEPLSGGSPVNTTNVTSLPAIGSPSTTASPPQECVSPALPSPRSRRIFRNLRLGSGTDVHELRSIASEHQLVSPTCPILRDQEVLDASLLYFPMYDEESDAASFCSAFC